MFYDLPSNYLKALPERLSDVEEIIAIANAINPEIDLLNEQLIKTVSNIRVLQATLDGIQRWESILGVSTPLNSTIEARRDALQARLMTKPPINMAVLEEIIEAYMGVDVDMSVDGHKVIVKYRGESRVADLTPLFVTMYDTIPAAMVVDISYRYLTWDEVDAQALTWDSLDEMGLTWDEFEKGEWVNG